MWKTTLRYSNVEWADLVRFLLGSEPDVVFVCGDRRVNAHISHVTRDNDFFDRLLAWPTDPANNEKPRRVFVEEDPEQVALLVDYYYAGCTFTEPEDLCRFCRFLDKAVHTDAQSACLKVALNAPLLWQTRLLALDLAFLAPLAACLVAPLETWWDSPSVRLLRQSLGVAEWAVLVPQLPWMPFVAETNLARIVAALPTTDPSESGDSAASDRLTALRHILWEQVPLQDHVLLSSEVTRRVAGRLLHCHSLAMVLRDHSTCFLPGPQCPYDTSATHCGSAVTAPDTVLRPRLRPLVLQLSVPLEVSDRRVARATGSLWHVEVVAEAETIEDTVRVHVSTCAPNGIVFLSCAVSIFNRDESEDLCRIQVSAGVRCDMYTDLPLLSNSGKVSVCAKLELVACDEDVVPVTARCSRRAMYRHLEANGAWMT